MWKVTGQPSVSLEVTLPQKYPPGLAPLPRGATYSCVCPPCPPSEKKGNEYAYSYSGNRGIQVDSRKDFPTGTGWEPEGQGNPTMRSWDIL